MTEQKHMLHPPKKAKIQPKKRYELGGFLFVPEKIRAWMFLEHISGHKKEVNGSNQHGFIKGIIMHDEADCLLWLADWMLGWGKNSGLNFPGLQQDFQLCLQQYSCIQIWTLQIAGERNDMKRTGWMDGLRKKCFVCHTGRLVTRGVYCRSLSWMVTECALCFQMTWHWGGNSCYAWLWDLVTVSTRSAGALFKSNCKILYLERVAPCSDTG